MRLLADIPSLDGWEALVRLSFACALGAIIGFERELRDREAGFRTHLLVSLGSALFTIVSAYGFHEFLVGGGNIVRTDPSRIAAQIVTGIGFLGAGAIIREGLSVRGLTTAATLWLVAAIGMSAGAGYYDGAIIATLGALLTLGPLRIVAYRATRRWRNETERLLVELPAGGSPGPVIEAVERFGRVLSLDVSQEADRREMAIDIQLHGETSPRVVAAVADLEGVLEVRWME
jgi:putative Mg2+ transporter-C (MgtC) family protein